MYNEYHRQAALPDFIVGVARCGVMVKRYTWISDIGCYSDYPLWQFPLDTLGM